MIKIHQQNKVRYFAKTLQAKQNKAAGFSHKMVKVRKD
jgi:hypothetical protein